eukprot:403375186
MFDCKPDINTNSVTRNSSQSNQHDLKNLEYVNAEISQTLTGYNGIFYQESRKNSNCKSYQHYFAPKSKSSNESHQQMFHVDPDNSYQKALIQQVLKLILEFTIIANPSLNNDYQFIREIVDNEQYDGIMNEVEILRNLMKESNKGCYNLTKIYRVYQENIFNSNDENFCDKMHEDRQAKSSNLESNQKRNLTKIQSSKQMTVHVVLQYIEGENLLDLLLKNQKFSEQKSSQILCGILQILRRVHQSGVIHRDIKLANILVEEDDLTKVYLLDFGISIFARDKPSTFKKCGSPGYCDPQILDGSPFRCKSDIFSLGCIFYNLITGKHLFPGDSYKEILFNNQFMDAQKSADRQLGNEISENFPIFHEIIITEQIGSVL